MPEFLNKYAPLPILVDGQRPASTVLKVASTGPDKRQVKDVSAAMGDLLKSIQQKPGHGYLHVVTLGAGDWFGPNYNADYYHEYPRRVHFANPVGPKFMDLGPGLADRHKTYLEFGGVYRNHRNGTKGYPSLGNIVWEHYSPTMHRGELVLELPESEWGPELDKYSRGIPLLWSQGSGVPGDVCSECGFVYTAKSPGRCSCMAKHKLAILPSGQQVYVYNPMATMHDMSYVGLTPADSTAFVCRRSRTAVIRWLYPKLNPGTLFLWTN